MEEGSQAITGLLSRWRSGDKKAAGELMEVVYGELHRIASRAMRREHGGHTLQTTALVHEAYIKLLGAEDIDWNNRAHFYAVAAQQLRRILIDYARRAHRERRGGGLVKLPLLEADGAALELDDRLIAVDQALSQLAVLDERAAKVVELRFFGGLTETESAETLGVSVATVKRDWDFARAWLASHLKT